jgi:hypothetical protein
VYVPRVRSLRARPAKTVEEVGAAMEPEGYIGYSALYPRRLALL